MASRGVAGSGPPTAHADAFVFFGATGDLAFKQIFPALAGLIRDGGWTMSISSPLDRGLRLERGRFERHLH